MAAVGEYTRQTKEAAHMQIPEQPSRNPGHMDINFIQNGIKTMQSIMQIRQNRLPHKMVSVVWKYGKMDIYIYPVQKNIVQSLDFKINDKGRLGVMMS